MKRRRWPAHRVLGEGSHPRVANDLHWKVRRFNPPASVSLAVDVRRQDGGTFDHPRKRFDVVAPGVRQHETTGVAADGWRSPRTGQKVIDEQTEVATLMTRLDEVVQGHVSYMTRQVERANAEHIHGRARFTGPHTVAIDRVRQEPLEVRAKNFYTDGSRTLETAVWEFANQQWASPSTLYMASGAGIDATSLVMRTAGDWSEAIWFEADGLSHGPVSTYFSSGAGAWSTPGNVADFNEDLKGDLDLHLDATGTAVATWRQDIGPATTLFASGHGPREAWSTPVGITLEGLGDVTEAHTAMTPEGDVVAVWHQSAGTMNDVIGFAKFTLADNQWSDPISVHTQMGGQLSSPGVHVDEAGNIIVMWFQAAEIPSEGTDLWTRQYHAATDTWGSESLAFESVNPPSRITFQEVDGKLLAVWDEYGSSGTRIFAAWKLLE